VFLAGDIFEFGYYFHHNGDYKKAIAFYSIIIEHEVNSKAVAQAHYDIGVSKQLSGLLLFTFVTAFTA
jgi:hypothetical protein